jgi:chemotaxis family two-component system response regulator Rcp1
MPEPIDVLLIEDNPGDADLTRETLELSKVFLRISVAVDGVDGLARMLGRPPYTSPSVPDLVLLDLNLPKLDGRETLAAMRGEQTLRTIPVVILTSSDAERDIVRSYELGANCYITKPVDLVAFQSIVRSVETFWLSVVRLP